MSKLPQRDIIKIIFQNLFKSLRPRQFRGNLIGEDYHGNKFYEIPADPANGRRKTARYFEPKVKADFEQEMTAEWESWLRGRRDDAPTEQELMRNLAIMKMKQKNAAQLNGIHKANRDLKELDEIKTGPPVRGIESFPSYGDEYEVSAGKDNKNNNKKS